MSFAYLFKFIIVGDQSVGKSSILMRFIDNQFREDTESTVGVQFGSKTIRINSEEIRLQIWDTAGQQTFKSITRSYYRGTIGAILVYDVSRRKSFENVSNWLEETQNYSTNENVVLILVGTKIDLNKRQISTKEGQQFATKHGLLFVESSSKMNVNIDKIFEQLSLSILGKIQRGQIDLQDENGGVKLGDQAKHQIPREGQKSCCKI